MLLQRLVLLARYATLSLSLLLTGCITLGSAPGEPTRHFTLHALSESRATPAESSTQGLTIGVGPIDLPSYLERPQIVTMRQQSEYELSSSAQWGEPLSENVKRVLAANLRELLATDRVVLFPWRRAIPVDLQVVADIQRFDAGPDDQARLVVNWSILDAKGQLLEMQQRRYQEQVGDINEPAAVVAALSRLLAGLSRDFADAILRAGT